MKIGILTFHFAKNYGAVYQAFALKTALSKMGHNADVVNYCPMQMRTGWDYSYCKHSKKVRLSTIKRFDLRSTLIELYNYAKFHLVDKKNISRKFELFDDFKLKYLCDQKNRLSTINDIKEIVKSYDAIVCGSDQIWNPNITNGFDQVYFTECLELKHKISYAASVGDITLLKDPGRFDAFINKVRCYNSISVREKNLADMLISQGLKCDVHCDPTFLLSSSDYEDCFPLDSNQRPPYVLVYHLLHDKNMLKYANYIAKTNNLKVVVVNGTLSSAKDSINNLGPVDFLKLLRNASIVITNSFHGIALSMIFHKDFRVFMPVAHKDRIINILTQYSLQDRIIKGAGQTELGKIDYSVVDDIINNNRNKALKYLADSLSQSVH